VFAIFHAVKVKTYGRNDGIRYKFTWRSFLFLIGSLLDSYRSIVLAQNNFLA
jgi:hypothetical protein